MKCIVTSQCVYEFKELAEDAQETVLENLFDINIVRLRKF